jgi:HEAT repeat protein
VNMLGSRMPVATLASLAQKGNDELLRIASLQALGRMAANEPASRKQAVAALDSEATDPSAPIQLNTGIALANAGQASALHPLREVLAGSDEPLRAEAVRGLAQLARTGNTDAYDALSKLSTDANTEVRTRAKNLLTQIGPRSSPTPSARLVYWIIAAGLIIAILATLAARRRKAV